MTVNIFVQLLIFHNYKVVSFVGITSMSALSKQILQTVEVLPTEDQYQVLTFVVAVGCVT